MVGGGEQGVGFTEDRAVDTEGSGVVLVCGQVVTLGYCHSERYTFFFCLFLITQGYMSVVFSFINFIYSFLI